MEKRGVRKWAALALLATCAWLPMSVEGQGAGDRNILIVQSKMKAAQDYFAKAWNEMFRSIGHPFAAPRVVAFLGSMQTGCGPVQAGNGFFCSADNAVYLDAAFLARNMSQAAAALGTDGDYAAIVIGAHEFGHVVADQLKAVTRGDEFPSEQVADCFAGVITRRAKTDGLLEAGDLAEGLFSLGNAGDEMGHNVKNTLEDRLHFILKLGGLSHGFMEQRQGAFLQGYYGGPAFCATAFGIARPPLAARAIVAVPLLPPAPLPFGARTNCVWSVGLGGLRMRDSAPQGQCTGNLLGISQTLPDHARIELTAAALSNHFSAGIYYGDGRSSGGLTRYAFETNELGGEGMKNIDRLQEVLGGLRVNGMPWNLDHINKRGENRLTMDIHHEGSAVYFLVFVNNFLVDFVHSEHGAARTARVRAADEAGISFAGTEAIFKDFRVSLLRD